MSSGSTIKLEPRGIEPTTAKVPNSKNHAQQYSKEYQIRNTLRKTKTYGLVLLILEVIVIFLGFYHYISINHPYFTDQVVPEFLQQLFTWLIVIFILWPLAMLNPVIVGILSIIATITTIICLITSIQQFKNWRKLQLPGQNYRLAIYSIVFNSVALIPIIAFGILLILALMH